MVANISIKDKNHKIPNFVDDNICKSTFPSNSFDLVFSWNVLEHIQQPELAISEIYRILKPNGIIYSKYNPFFCQGGGHSLATLDFPWGHVRLDESNIKKYLIEIRPQEYDIAYPFYKNSLNRMTINDLKTYHINAGFELLALVPIPKQSNIYDVTEEILEQSKINYPKVEFIDLVSNGVVCVARKK